MPPDPAFDDVLLSSARLGIVTALFARDELTFSELKHLLELTQGNLGVHLTKLEDAGYVDVAKEFVDRRPRTSARLTKKGRAAFLAHVRRLDAIARGAEG